MSSRRTIKKLMAAGIQRNDAAAFVKTYNKIKAAGMTNLFHEWICPFRNRLLRSTKKPSTRYDSEQGTALTA